MYIIRRQNLKYVRTINIIEETGFKEKNKLAYLLSLGSYCKAAKRLLINNEGLNRFPISKRFIRGFFSITRVEKFSINFDHDFRGHLIQILKWALMYSIGIKEIVLKLDSSIAVQFQRDILTLFKGKIHLKSLHINLIDKKGVYGAVSNQIADAQLQIIGKSLLTMRRLVNLNLNLYSSRFTNDCLCSFALCLEKLKGLENLRLIINKQSTKETLTPSITTMTFFEDLASPVKDNNIHLETLKSLSQLPKLSKLEMNAFVLNISDPNNDFAYEGLSKLLFLKHFKLTFSQGDQSFDNLDKFSMMLTHLKSLTKLKVKFANCTILEKAPLSNLTASLSFATRLETLEVVFHKCKGINYKDFPQFLAELENLKALTKLSISEGVVSLPSFYRENDIKTEKDLDLKKSLLKLSELSQIKEINFLGFTLRKPFDDLYWLYFDPSQLQEKLLLSLEFKSYRISTFFTAESLAKSITNLKVKEIDFNMKSVDDVSNADLSRILEAISKSETIETISIDCPIGEKKKNFGNFGFLVILPKIPNLRSLTLNFEGCKMYEFSLNTFATCIPSLQTLDELKIYIPPQGDFMSAFDPKDLVEHISNLHKLTSLSLKLCGFKLKNFWRSFDDLLRKVKCIKKLELILLECNIKYFVLEKLAEINTLEKLTLVFSHLELNKGELLSFGKKLKQNSNLKECDFILTGRKILIPEPEYEQFLRIIQRIPEYESLPKRKYRY